VAILRPMLMPTVGIPQTVVASRRPRNMSQREFYSQNARQLPQLQQPDYAVPQQLTQQAPQVEQFEQPAMTGDYIQQQLARLNQRAAPPSLEPGSRVKSAEAELVQPSNFQSYYEQLNAVRNKSQQMLGAEAARALYKRSQSLGSDALGLMSGLPARYKNTGSGSKKKSLSKGGNAYGSAIPSNPKANFKFAQELGPQFGWSGPELQAWYTLGMKESGWRNTAQNPTSTAFGIGQFLNSTWKGVGIAKTSDPKLQVLAMARYIKNRYGSPSRALAFHLRNNWY
jgi:hypothetical protein